MPISHYFSRYFYGVTKETERRSGANDPFFIFSHDTLRTVGNSAWKLGLLQPRSQGSLLPERTLGTRLRFTFLCPLTNARRPLSAVVMPFKWALSFYENKDS